MFFCDGLCPSEQHFADKVHPLCPSAQSLSVIHQCCFVQLLSLREELYLSWRSLLDKTGHAADKIHCAACEDMQTDWEFRESVCCCGRGGTDFACLTWRKCNLS